MTEPTVTITEEMVEAAARILAPSIAPWERLNPGIRVVVMRLARCVLKAALAVAPVPPERAAVEAAMNAYAASEETK